jgi:hypothetical protein
MPEIRNWKWMEPNSINVDPGLSGMGSRKHWKRAHRDWRFWVALVMMLAQ